MNNVRYEHELYQPMCEWLRTYLNDKYSRQNCEIFVVDCHSVNLDSVLIAHDVIHDYPQAVGLQIEIDVLGIVKWDSKSEIVFIEAKKTRLNLHDLGQLWAYCKLCDPAEAFLLSSAGVGSLEKVLVNLKREDMLDYGSGKKIKKMKVGKWDVARNNVDHHSLVPKL